MENNNSFINHYSSEYYDPAKAHEYYLRTRKLKGRTIGGMSDAQKEAWGYAKQKITEERNLKMEQLKEKAQQARERLSNKIAQFAKAESSTSERLRIAKELKTAIASLRAEYEKIFDREYDNVLSKIEGKAPKKSKPKKEKKPEVDWETFDKT